MGRTLETKTIVLPGNSVENKNWAYEVKENVFDNSPDVIVLEYEHWKNNTGFINIEVEEFKIKNLGVTDVYIFAKSIGILLSMDLYKKNIININKAMFLGVPGGLFSRLGINLENEIRNFDVDTVCLQNEFDPSMTFDELYKVVVNSGNPRWEVMCGNGLEIHHYPDFKLIRSCWDSLLSLSREDN